MNLIVVLFALFISTGQGLEGFGPGEQDWGYVTVRPGAHMFWWLYYTTADVESYTERPLIMWLQGGPGASSTGFGNFAELGPLDYYLNERNYTWVKDANVIFVDNPVGTGYSYVESSSALTTTNKEIADDLVELMRQFYEQNPEFKEVPFYVVAESYGGKMTAEFALELDSAIKEGKIESNFIGVGLGDSWVSPIDSVMTWAPFLLYIGAVDQQGYEDINAAAIKTKEAFDAGEYAEATTQWARTEGVIMKASHNVDFYNVLKKIPASSRGTVKMPSVRDDEDDLIEALMNGAVKEALNLTVNWGSQSGAVFSTLRVDFMKPVTEIVELLLNTTDIKVYVFSGQLDLICDTPGTVIWVDNLKWNRKSEWEQASRNAVAVNGINEGYVKKVGNLALYWVNRAGHMVPSDNPAAMDAILRSLTTDYSGDITRSNTRSLL